MRFSSFYASMSIDILTNETTSMSINAIKHVNNLKDKIQMIIFNRNRKKFYEIQLTSLIKVLEIEDWRKHSSM